MCVVLFHATCMLLPVAIYTLSFIVSVVKHIFAEFCPCKKFVSLLLWIVILDIRFFDRIQKFNFQGDLIISLEIKFESVPRVKCFINTVQVWWQASQALGLGDQRTCRV